MATEAPEACSGAPRGLTACRSGSWPGRPLPWGLGRNWPCSPLAFSPQIILIIWGLKSSFITDFWPPELSKDKLVLF